MSWSPRESNYLGDCLAKKAPHDNVVFYLSVGCQSSLPRDFLDILASEMLSSVLVL